MHREASPHSPTGMFRQLNNLGQKSKSRIHDRFTASSQENKCHILQVSDEHCWKTDQHVCSKYRNEFEYFWGQCSTRLTSQIWKILQVYHLQTLFRLFWDPLLDYQDTNACLRCGDTWLGAFTFIGVCHDAVEFEQSAIVQLPHHKDVVLGGSACAVLQVKADRKQRCQSVVFTLCVHSLLYHCNCRGDGVLFSAIAHVND